MEEIRNSQTLEKIFTTNGGYITREDVDKNNIASWFLSDFVKKKELVKLAPGFYADESYPVDEYFLFQRKYSKFIFSGMSSLYLLGLTDKIPFNVEVTGPIGYNPLRKENDDVVVHRVSDKAKYLFGIINVKTAYGNVVKTYNAERTICEIVKRRKNYDSETFVKAIKLYIQKYNDQAKLFEYARFLGVENKLFDVIECFV